MTRFLQLHALTVYPPSNPNRDDSNRPKTVRYGFAERLRISSQSLKRAWRVSGEFSRESVGTRLANSKNTLENYLKQCFEGKIHGVTPKAGITEEERDEIIKALIEELTNNEDKLVTLSHAEMERVHNIVRNGSSLKEEENTKAKSKRTKNTRAYGIFQTSDLSADVAMFGRMLTHRPEHNVEAAVQVSHAFTVHAGSIEDDYFTAVNELQPKESAGAGFVDFRAFGGGGVYYLYVCVNIDLLLSNLNNNTEAAQQAVKGLVNAMTKVAPSGMQNSFGSRVRCEYLLAEYSTQQPRSLATAFLQAVYGDKHDNPLEIAKRRLEHCRNQIDAIYGKAWDDYRVMGSTEHNNEHQGKNVNLDGIIEFCTNQFCTKAIAAQATAQQEQPQQQEQQQEQTS
ncbi:MAG: type I-E CRISPR-associated protein Cas7/Cse4/CasC [Bacteroidota bacterium]|nr:type I-E CRISPR-associated protein Cas7/Cse4/CasC [Candidatus Kapabacteria bacterium]MDW8220794.1 type I-E CRISPR-associated protein Cas7/Cse4/CasC [Bacteroidota bacterium]